MIGVRRSGRRRRIHQLLSLAWNPVTRALYRSEDHDGRVGLRIHVQWEPAG